MPEFHRRGKLHNLVIFHSCESMQEIEDHSSKLVILSPPFSDFTKGKILEKSSYLEFIANVLRETHRIMLQDGTLVSINTDFRDHPLYNNGNPIYEGTVWFKHNDIRQIAEKVGFKCIDYKIWIKSLNVNVYRYNFAHILFFCKKEQKPFRPGWKNKNTNFKADVWLLKGGTQRKSSNGQIFRNAIHPEIAERCIEELTSQGDLVVSPFAGSGTILAVAEFMNRKWVGYEVDERLKSLIEESIYGPNYPKIYKDVIKKYQDQNKYLHSRG